MGIFWRSIKFLRQITESFAFAWQAMRSNLLRTTLSLLGVTIGIFAIITVFTVVDSLERKIREDMSFIGSDVIYIQRFPWGFGTNDYPWWKYFQRPTTNVNEFKFLEKNVKQAEAISFIAQKPNNTIKYKNNSYSQVFLQGVSYGYSSISEIEVADGRYFSPQEIDNNKNVCLIGHEITKALFPLGLNPIGKSIKVRNRYFVIIGVMKKEGTNLFGFSSRDNLVLIPYTLMTKMFKVGDKGIEPFIGLKGRKDDPSLQNLEGELTGLLRSKRSLKPTQESNFALNRTESFSDAISSLFAVVSTAGWFIGIFSILVGGFGIANIMFVSIKERTHIIGIQKSLGAKNYFILFQFLFEALLLSLIGGLVGILIVYFLTYIPLGSLTLYLSFKNILLGLMVSSIVGVLSGIIPAWIAARMDPVVAIRSK